MQLISFDVSSSTVGWAILNIDDKNKISLYKSGWFKPYKKSHIFDNLSHLKQDILDLLQKYKPDKAAIEDIAQFFPGKSSANTIITLALYNRVVGLTVFEYLNQPPELCSVMAIRHGIKLDKQLPSKEEIPALVEKKLGIILPVQHKKTGTIRSELYDEADAIACGLYSCLKLTGQLKKK